MNTNTYTLTPASRVRVDDVIMKVSGGVEVEVGRVKTALVLPAGSVLIELDTFGAHQWRYCVPPTYAFYVRECDPVALQAALLDQLEEKRHELMHFERVADYGLDDDDTVDDEMERCQREYVELLAALEGYEYVNLTARSRRKLI